MELHPIVDKLFELRPNLWCVVTPSGEGPSARVGHTCMFLGGKDGGDLQGNERPRILIIGGGNPDGVFDDVYCLDIDALKWNKVGCQGLSPRYEHSSFSPVSNLERVVVFGGASKTENLNDLKEYDKVKDAWINVQVSGTPPSRRTCHSMASLGDNLYVFGGGYQGAEPVQDRDMHVYDAGTKTWSRLQTSGDKPSARHGHVMVTIGTDIFLHGGMSGSNIYNDLYKFCTSDKTWCKVQSSGDIPDGRTAHAGTVLNHDLYIFGGLSARGSALDDFYKLNIDTFNWSQIKIETLPPDPRLDHAMCTLSITRPPLDEKQSKDSSEMKKCCDVIFLFGGMDTNGVILNDCFVFYPTE